MPEALAVSRVAAGYTRVPVISDVTASFAEGTVTGLLGANGAGKSTLLKVLCGLLRTSEGTVTLYGEDVTGTGVADRARRGLAFVLEGGRVFERMTVEENIRAAWAAVHGFRRDPVHDKARELALDAFPVLSAKSTALAAALSGGERQMLAVARGIASAPRILLLDEPSVGLSVKMVTELISALRVLRDAGLTVIVAEQNLRVVEQCSDQCLVLRHGRLAWIGAPGQLAGSEEVRDAVIGGDVASNAQEV